MPPAKAAGHLLEPLDREAGRKAAANQSTGRRSGNCINGCAAPTQPAQRAPVRDPARRAAEKPQPNAGPTSWPVTCHGGLKSRRWHAPPVKSRAKSVGHLKPPIPENEVI